MPGKHDRNLRSGYIHEDLGALLLRPIALVAPVPRSDDVGIDAVATLCRPEDGRRLIPEDTFAVQFKASSVRVIPFDDADAARWVLNLELPFFIGSVRLDAGAIDLYPTHRLFMVRHHPHLKEVQMHLDGGCAERLGSPEVASICIGPPAASWAIDSLADPDFPRCMYPVLKGHIQEAQRSILGRPMGHFEPVTWQPGQPPQRAGGVFIQHGGSGNEDEQTLAALVAPIRSLLMSSKLRREVRLLPAIFAFIQTLRQLGIDPDPEDLCMKGAAAGPPEEERILVREQLLALGMTPVRYHWGGGGSW